MVILYCVLKRHGRYTGVGEKLQGCVLVDRLGKRVKETQEVGKWSLENVAACCVRDSVGDGGDLGSEEAF